MCLKKPFASFCLLLFAIPICLAQKPKLVLPFGHSKQVTTIAYSPDGKYIATAAEDNTAIIWDARTSKSVHLLRGHVENINSIDFSTDGKYAVTASSDKSAMLWDTHSGQLVYVVTPQEHAVMIARFSPDNKQLLIGCADGKSFTWSVGEKRIITVLQEKKTEGIISFPAMEKNAVREAVFSADGTHVLTQTGEGIVTVYLTSTGTPVYTGKTADPNFLLPAQRLAGFTPDAKKLLLLAPNGFRLIDLKDTLNILSPEKKADQGFVNFAVSPGSDTLVAYHLMGAVVKWDLHTGKCIYMKEPQTGFAYYYQAAFSFFNQTIITASGDSSIKVWDMGTGELRYQEKAGTVINLLLSPGNDYYAINELKKDVVIRKLATGNRTGYLTTHINTINNAVIDEKNGHLLSASQDNMIRIWNLGTGRIEKIIPDIDGYESKVQLSDRGNYFYTWYSNVVKVFNAVDGSLKQELGGGSVINLEKGSYDKLTSATISPNEKYIAASSSDHSIKVWDIQSGKRLFTLNAGEWGFSKTGFSPDSKYIAGVSVLGQILIWNLATHTIIDSFKTKPLTGTFFLSPTANLLCFENLQGKIITYDIDKRKIISTIVLATKEDVRIAAFSSNSKMLIISGEFVSTIWDIATAKKITTIEQESYSVAATRFGEEDKEAVIVSSDGMIHYYTIPSGAENAYLRVDANAVTDINGPYGNYFLATSPESIYLYNALTDQSVKFTPIDRTGCIVTTDTGWYTSTPDAAQWLSWTIGDKVFDFDQWDIQYNRPDKVLEMLGNTDTALLAAYKGAFEKRVRKMQLDTSALRDDYHIPETVIINATELEGVSKADVVMLKVHCFETDKTNSLTKLFISVNGNPLYGRNGLAMQRSAVIDTVFEIPVSLSRGLNAIKISCMNNRAAESLRQLVYINHEPLHPVPPKTYFIGIGVSAYKDSSYNLRYAAKDVKDFSAALKDKYPAAIVHLVTNEEATAATISSIKKELLQTNPDDRVIVSLSGHGIIDPHFDFYFGTWDIDFKNPAAEGLSYDRLEWLLDSVPARNKLVLMDACHSGELDKEGSYTTGINEHPADGSVKEVRGLIVTANDKTGTGMKNTFELMQGLFANIGRGNGATIISAAAGTEFAFEGNKWANGVFTYCVLKGLKDLAADADKDGVITVTELQNYVSVQVEKLTNGKQKPTSRQTNFDNDWEIWKK